MTKYEKIKNMSIEEMVEEFEIHTRSCFGCNGLQYENECIFCIKNYLEHEAK